MVAVEELEEARLGAGRAFVAEGLEAFETIFEVFEVGYKIVSPESGAFTDGCRLRGLKMCQSETGKSAIFFCEFGEPVDNDDEAIANHAKSFAIENTVAVVGDEATSGSQVDDCASVRADVAVSMDMGHDVVSEFFFVCGGGFEVDIVEMSFEFVDLRLAYWQSELMLGFGERDP